MDTLKFVVENQNQATTVSLLLITMTAHFELTPLLDGWEFKVQEDVASVVEAMLSNLGVQFRKESP